jgi:hypothetical protein
MEVATKYDTTMMFGYANIADSTTFGTTTYKQPVHEPVQIFEKVNESEGDQLPDDPAELRGTLVLLDFHDDEVNEETMPAPEESNVSNPTAKA